MHTSGEWKYHKEGNTLQNGDMMLVVTSEIEQALVDYELSSGLLEAHGIKIDDIQDVYNVLNDARDE